MNTRWVKLAGFALTAAFAGAVGAAMSVRWTYIDPPTVFNPFIGFQTVLIALIGGALTLWGPLIAAIVFSLLAETLRLQAPQVYMMSLGLLLILSVLYLPGGLASLRWDTFRGWRDGARAWWKERRDGWSGDKARDERRAAKAAAACAERPRALLEARAVTVRFGGLVAVDAVSATLRTPASWWASSAPTAPARPPSSTRSRACWRRPRAGCSSPGDDLTGQRPAPLRGARPGPHLPDAARVRRHDGARPTSTSA